jgi:hypothetical protein
MPFDLARGRLLSAVVVVSGVLVVAGCGSSSKPTTSSRSASTLASPGVGFAECMRSHGVPNLPDPTTAVGPYRISLSGINPGSPSFQAAQKLCGMSGGGPGSAKPSAAAVSQMTAIARCMRAHGVTDFPDPTTRTTTNPVGYGAVITHDGVYFAIPSTVNLQAPAAKRAASACQLSGLVGGGPV